MVKVDKLVEAGAYIAPTGNVSPDVSVDAVSARVYEHRALGARPVVRLTPDSLAAGDDLAMDFLGFQSPMVVGPVARRRRQALGFPGWALIHDPEHAKFALEVVKTFRKAARRCRTKPGHAYEEFSEIAEQLGRSVCHFLPSFWEEVGREYMGLGNSTYAARAFGRARDAERVHALKVDENLRKDAFLEFALAGCLTTKALVEYSKDLQSSHQADDAWLFFRELIVRRTLGGIPPWTTLRKDIKPLILAAKLDEEKESEKLIREIIDSPSMVRASDGFWTAYKKTIARMIKTENKLAGRLINMIPASRWDHTPIWKWFRLLDEWKLLPNVYRTDVPDEVKPAKSLATRRYPARS